MIRTKRAALMLAGVLMVPAFAAAQSLAPLGYDRSRDDLGTWDAIVEGRDDTGRRTTRRVVEINTPGCNDTCVITQVNGAVPSSLASIRSGAWWEAGGLGPADGLGTTFYQTGMTQGSTVPGVGVETQAFLLPLPPAAGTVVAGVPPSRVSIERQGNDKRIVTLYRRGVKRPVTLHGSAVSDTETVYARITYTRRR